MRDQTRLVENVGGRIAELLKHSNTDWRCAAG